MSESKQPPILIVGAGIAGLSLAAILQRNSIPYHVFESSPRTRSQGQGITLHSWAYLPLCKALDIDPGQLRHAVATDSAIGGTGAIDLTVHNIYSGGSLKSDFGTPVWGAVNNVYSFRSGKSAIQELLMKKVDPDMISWEWKLRSSELRNGLVVAGFENGESMTGRLIVAADGLHSVGRSYLIPEIKPTTTDLTVYNGRRTVTRALFNARFGPYMQNTTVLSGHGDGFAHFEININSITDTEVVISWTYSRDGSSSVSPSLQLSQPHPKIATAIITELAQLRDLAAPFNLLIEKKEMEDDTLYNWIMRSVRIPLKSLSALATKRIVLIGDAAHAMPIYKGTGGNQALVDSLELASLLCLAKSDGSQQSTDLPDTQLALAFYGKAYKRWQDATLATESKLRTLHRPIEALGASGSE